MSPALLAACLWALCANLVALLPTRDAHWRAAYLLAGLGVPLLGWVTWRDGPMAGVLVLAAGVSILRWPVWYLWCWLSGRPVAQRRAEAQAAAVRIAGVRTGDSE